MDYREITIYGRLGRDCEVKTYGENKQLLTFAVGTTCGFGYKQKTIWYKCTSFRGMDLKIAQYLTKGQPVIVCGEHGKDEWTDQAGVAKSADTINITKIVLLEKAPAQNQAPQPPAQQQYQSYNQQQAQQAQQPANGGWGGPPPQQKQGPAAQPPAGGWGGAPSDDEIPFN